MKRWLAAAILASALAAPAEAQCVMCYRTAHAQNNARARVLDMGIVILGAPPFLILAGFIAFVFAKDKAGQQTDESERTFLPGRDGQGAA